MDGIRELRQVITPTVMGYEKDARGSGLFHEVNLPIVMRVDRNGLVLKEMDPLAKLRKIYLTDLDSSGLALKPDNFGVRFFTSGQWNKAVDYLVLTKHKGVNYAVFIDLKSSLNDKPDPSDNLLVTNSNADMKKEKQFVGAKALFDYIKLIVKRETNSSALDDYQIRSWILYEEIKSRSPMQSEIMTTACVRKKSTFVVTRQVADASTVSVLDLIKT